MSAAARGDSVVDRPALAASLMIVSLSVLSLQDGLVKLAAEQVSFWQFQMLRAVLNFTFIVVAGRLIVGGRARPPQRLWAVTLRSLLLACATLCFFSGAPFLSLAEMTAGFYMFPLFVAVLSALFLGERVGPRRVAAIAVGFTGALLILKPGSEAFRAVALLPVCAAVFYASAILCTRRLCRAESPMTLVYGVAITLFCLGSVGLIAAPALAPTGWAADWPYLFGAAVRMDWPVLGLVLACSLLNVSANIGLAKAYQSAEASWLAPFDYSYLAFSAIWGFALFARTPGPLTALGMLMIACSGAYVAWRERRLTRLRAAVADCAPR